MIHSQILKEYEKDFNGDFARIIKRATSRQNIIRTDSKDLRILATKEDFEDYLKKNSKVYSNIYNANFIAKGGEAIVYRIIHEGLDEIVAKCPIFPADASKGQIIEAYASIFYES